MKTKFIASIGVLLAVGVQVGQAISIDLTSAGSSGFANDGFFQQVGDQSTGTGVITPFLRLQASPEEDGYNTSLNPAMPDVKNDGWTRDVLVSEIPVVKLGSTDYLQFLLDIHESTGHDGEFLTLNSLRIFVKNGALTVGNDLSHLVSNATEVWNLDALEDSKVELNSVLNSGSGSGDMFAYIPRSAFGANYQGSFNLYLYSAFGPTPYDSNSTFEEWSFLKNASTIPTDGRVPDGGTTLLSLGFALLGLGSLRRHLVSKA